MNFIETIKLIIFGVLPVCIFALLFALLILQFTTNIVAVLTIVFLSPLLWGYLLMKYIEWITDKI